MPTIDQVAGILSKAFSYATTTANAAATAVTQMATATNGSVSGVVQGVGGMFTSILGSVGSVASKIPHPVAQVVAVVANGAAAVVKTVTGAVGEMLETSLRLASLFRPDLAIRFEQVMKDALAAVGENLVPVVKVATQAIKWMGDQIAGTTRHIRPEIQAVANAFADIGQQLAVAWKEAGPALVLVVAGTLQSVAGMIKLASAMTQVATITTKVTTGFFGLATALGLLGDFKGNSAGKAFTESRFTSTDDLSRTLMKATFGSTKEDAAEVSKGYLFEIKGMIEHFAGDLGKALKMYISAKEGATQGSIGVIEGAGFNSIMSTLKGLWRTSELKRS